MTASFQRNAKKRYIPKSLLLLFKSNTEEMVELLENNRARHYLPLLTARPRNFLLSPLTPICKPA